MGNTGAHRHTAWISKRQGLAVLNFWAMLSKVEQVSSCRSTQRSWIRNAVFSGSSERRRELLHMR
jgi:hypothetical protein